MTIERRCPCCGQQMPSALATRAILKELNTQLYKLTNPPHTIQGFYDAAQEILEETGVELGEELAHVVTSIPSDRWHFTSTDPFTVNTPIDKWGTILTLQGCYGKIEVAYFS